VDAVPTSLTTMPTTLIVEMENLSYYLCLSEQSVMQCFKQSLDEVQVAKHDGV
jgi:hypothetical protein